VWTREEFGRQVADHAHILGLIVGDGGNPALHQPIAYGVGQRHVEIVDSGAFERSTLHKQEIVEKGACQGFDGKSRSMALL